MNHGFGDFNAGREAVGENAARLAFQDRQQLAAEFGIAGIEMQGCRQLAFEALGDFDHFFCAFDRDDQAERSEDFF
ncbi:hypothetical protein D3C87_882480 [compost metagenome]